jgi:uncharacterized protein YbbC (DUF1343 family)
VSGFSTGLDRVARGEVSLPPGPLGLLCNQATIDARLRGTVEVVREAGGRVERIFSPQHGFAGEKQDNMIESGHGVHPATGIPLISLYGETREPTPEMLAGLSALLIDLPDVGTRVYTFLSTALLCLKVCAEVGLPIVVLDRPNPIGGEIVEGPILRPEFASFVGLIPVPLRHGLTTAEYLRFAREIWRLDLPIETVTCTGWPREAMFPAQERPWIPPSPNLPTFEGALVYPGLVMLEGTNLSEGRGTTRPFEIWGAPWLDPPALIAAARAHLPGLVAREVAFRPTFHKFTGLTCRGLMLHPMEFDRVRAVESMVALLCAVARRHRGEFAWKEPPYEYERTRMPIDLIAGTDELRTLVESGSEPAEILRAWDAGLEEFRERRRPSLLYPESRS